MAGHEMTFLLIFEWRVLAFADIHYVWTARIESTSGRGVQKVGRLTWD